MLCEQNYLAGVIITQYKNIVPFPTDKYDTYEFLNAADVLVTDYSSVFFDFAASGRKIVLFTYDKEEYMQERGMYSLLEESAQLLSILR